MRVVARSAGDARVIGVIAAAAFQTIALKAHIFGPLNSHYLLLRWGSMAGPAEIRDPAGRKVAGIEDARILARILGGSTPHSFDVVRSGTVAALTRHSRDHPIHLEAIGRGGCSGVALKAAHQGGVAQPVA